MRVADAIADTMRGHSTERPAARGRAGDARAGRPARHRRSSARASRTSSRAASSSACASRGAGARTRRSSSSTSPPPGSTSSPRPASSRAPPAPRRGARGHALRHPRPGGGRADRRPHRGHVRRAHRRGGPGRRGAAAAAPSVHPRADGVDPRPRRGPGARGMPGAPVDIADRPPGCPFRRAARRSARLRRRVPVLETARAEPLVRCSEWTRTPPVDWAAQTAAAAREAADRASR